MDLNVVSKIIGLVYDVNFFSIVDLVNLEHTCKEFNQQKELFRLKRSIQTNETFEQQVVYKNMAACIQTNEEFIRTIVDVFEKKCYLSGSLLLSTIVGSHPYRNPSADLDIYIDYPVDEHDREIFHERLFRLVKNQFEPNGFFLAEGELNKGEMSYEIEQIGYRFCLLYTSDAADE